MFVLYHQIVQWTCKNHVRNRYFRLYLENEILKYFLNYRFQQLILFHKTGKIVDVAYIDTKSNEYPNPLCLASSSIYWECNNVGLDVKNDADVKANLGNS